MATAASGNARQTLRLAGAADAALAGAGADLSSIAFWSDLLVEHIGPARAALGQEADAVYQEGRTLALEEAVAEALGQL
jgi:hypothetical protein